MSMIEVRNLHKSFDDCHVLKGIDLTIKKGSVFALLGPNGAGKTTTIKILSTLIKPDDGHIELAGIDLVKFPDDVKQYIALTGQYAAVDEVLTGRENLRMIGYLLKIPNVKDRVENLLEAFDLMESANRRVSTYSGGMKRKIDIAMSLIGHPSVIFLDEPTTGLDPQSRKTMWKMIKNLAKTGVTIVLTTQYLDEAEVLADKITILDEGRVIAEGTCNDLKEIIASDIITFTFDSDIDTQRAGMILKEYQPDISCDEQEIRIEIRGSISEIVKLHEKLERKHIKIKNFEKKRVKLEDVFLEIIKTKRKGVR